MHDHPGEDRSVNATTAFYHRPLSRDMFNIARVADDA
jgi:hypothetical protein